MRSAQSAHVAVQGVVVVGRYQALSPHLARHFNSWQRWLARRVPAWTVGEAEHLTIGTDADVIRLAVAHLYPSAAVMRRLHYLVASRSAVLHEQWSLTCEVDEREACANILECDVVGCSRLDPLTDGHHHVAVDE